MALRIATFNLENLDDRPDLGPPFERRVAILRPQLLRLNADVLCLQEINGQRQHDHAPRQLRALDKLLDTTPYAAFQRVSTTSRSGHGVADIHNLVILSRWPIETRREVRHDYVAPPRYRPVTAVPPATEAQPVEWDRPILAAALRLPGGRLLHIVNLHLRAPLAAAIPGQKRDPFSWKSAAGWAEGFFMAAVKRTGQALETRLLIERVFDADPQAWIAVCGDFNAEERETPLRVLRADVDDTGNAALAGRTLVPLDRMLPETRRYTVLHGGRHAMLDHVMVSRALLSRYRHVEVHNERLGDELVAYESGRPSAESYHAPVVAEFAFADAPERLNTGAVPLNRQELRNCVYRGPYNALLISLSENPDFQFLMGLKGPEKRMRDVEYVLRFAAFYHATYLKYKPPMARFLDEDMRKFQHASKQDQDELTDAFKKSVALVRSLLGNHAFRRFYRGDASSPDGRWEPKKFNASLYDVLMCSFADKDKNTVMANLDAIREGYISLMTNNRPVAKVSV
jgi:endonuclease/exonuclease/phosphatase family metal-dependent hydrolase